MKDASVSHLIVGFERRGDHLLQTLLLLGLWFESRLVVVERSLSFQRNRKRSVSKRPNSGR
jgi:hypothetical protein